jgi:predicted nuclease with RNAse H fold
VRSLGIDVGVRKGLDVVLLDESLAILDTHSRVAVDQLGGLIEEAEPDVIAVDAPPRWAFRSGGSRLTERELRALGIQVFGTPSEDRYHDKPFYEWMKVGFDVFGVAERRGFSRYAPPGSPLNTVMEVYPHASAVVLAGCLQPTSATKREWRERVLEARGVRASGLRSADQVDAALAALTGLLALEGVCFAPGDPREGVIVLPARTLPAGPYKRAPEPERADDGQLVFRGMARCACGDPSCRESTAGEFARGHDSKRKSMLWEIARQGKGAVDELRGRGWEVPPELR